MTERLPYGYNTSKTGAGILDGLTIHESAEELVVAMELSIPNNTVLLGESEMEISAATKNTPSARLFIVVAQIGIVVIMGVANLVNV